MLVPKTLLSQHLFEVLRCVSSIILDRFWDKTRLIKSFLTITSTKQNDAYRKLSLQQ